MSKQEIEIAIRAHAMRGADNDYKIVQIARGMVAVLRDAGRHESAKTLEAALFIRDAEEQEHKRWISENLAEVIPVLFAMMREK